MYKTGISIALSIILLTLTTGVSFCQPKFTDSDPNCIKIGQESEILSPAVHFIERTPRIDGILDEELKHLPLRGFNYVRFHADETFAVVPIRYRLAYGTEFLYVYVEVDDDQIFYNDRAFQNGDGFQLLIAEPKENNARTDEFYVIACSAVNRDNLEWTRRVIFVNNITNLFVPLSADAEMKHRARNERIFFGLLLPWKDIPPFHPWLTKDIGFNLKFVKASETQPTSDYYVYPDREMAQENQMPLYCHLQCERPRLERSVQAFVQLNRNHVHEGHQCGVTMATLSAESLRQTVEFRGYSQGNSMGLTTSETVEIESGVDKHVINLDKVSALPTGDYTIRWRLKGTQIEGRDQLTVLSKFGADELKSRLGTAQHQISKGSYESLLYLIDRSDGFLKSLRPYQSASNARRRIERLVRTVDEASQGTDSFAANTGFFTRAYLSELDSTYQPYTVRIPENLDRSTMYPLIVFLHGSGSDETDLSGFSFIGDGECIELGPFGRGRSNFYCTDNAQEDIAEAIDAVIESYPIDTTRIVLTGFSMGGYGVYRTFYETPDKFKALAVFSGLPFFSADTEKFPDEIYPNFLDEAKAKRFRGTPIFIFHGEQDLNCPISRTETLVSILKRSGVPVTFVTEKDKGHQRPDPDTIREYHKWLEETLRK